jgi:hypothetical protein
MIRRAKPAVPKELLALVPEHGSDSSTDREVEESRGARLLLPSNDIFGDTLTKKKRNTLRIGFQNIGGFTLKRHKLKDDLIRRGINKYDFDIFGMAETNTNWRLCPEQDKLYFRTKEWWDSVHLSHSHNCTSRPTAPHQWGGTALFSLNKSSHRVIGKGADETKLGRWCWTLYRGRNNHTLRLYTGYCPNPPSGPLSVYAQHRRYLTSHNDMRCPREAFIQDICKSINKANEEGNHIILLIDGNSNMKDSALKIGLEQSHLKEAIIHRHGRNGPSTFRRNNNNSAIDGIWISPGLEIQAGGYFAFDELIQNTDHRCLWVELTFREAFGHNMPAVVRPKTRRLHNRDPRIVANFHKTYERLAKRYNLVERALKLDEASTHPLSLEHQYEYETLDAIRCDITACAEKRCRKLRKGQVAYSPQVHLASIRITAWSLLQKHRQGLKVSSRLLKRSMKKANLSNEVRMFPMRQIQNCIKEAYQHYYQLKGNDRELRYTFLEKLAEAVAADGNTSKEKALKQLREREGQRETATKIKYLSGKLNRGSTTMVSIETTPGVYKDITAQSAIEQAIMKRKNINNHIIRHSSNSHL